MVSLSNSFKAAIYLLIYGKFLTCLFVNFSGFPFYENNLMMEQCCHGRFFLSGYFRKSDFLNNHSGNTKTDLEIVFHTFCQDG